MQRRSKIQKVLVVVVACREKDFFCIFVEVDDLLACMRGSGISCVCYVKRYCNSESRIVCGIISIFIKLEQWKWYYGNLYGTLLYGTLYGTLYRRTTRSNSNKPRCNN